MRAFYILLIAPLACALACGGSVDNSNPNPSGGDDAGGGNPDSGIGADAGSFDAAPPIDATPAPFPAFKIDAPQVVSAGGPVLKTPKVTPIFLPGFQYTKEVTDYAATLGATKFWSASVGEYGVGALTSNMPITSTDAPASGNMNISDQDIQNYVSSRFDGTHMEYGSKPDPDTIYTLFFPTTTTISLGGGGGGGGQSCQSFGGYHDNVTVNGQDVAYAVIPDCGSFGMLNGLDALTGTTSHEWEEAVTDPFPSTQPAYGSVDDAHAIWEFFLGGGEVGDMCAQFSSSFYKPDGYAYVVQRPWSNASAKAGHDPCQPELDNEVYFNSAPVFPDMITLGGGGQTFTTEGIKIPVGMTKTLELDLFSEAPTTGPWNVTVQGLTRGGGAAPLSFTYDKQSGQNGDKIMVSITATAASTSPSKTSRLLITSQLGATKHIWLGLVAN